MSDRASALTVAELVDVLAQLPADAPVQIEGCDCQGWSHRVTTTSDGAVWIRREHGEDYEPDGARTWPADRRPEPDDEDD